jgi:hypothetical protein
MRGIYYPSSVKNQRFLPASPQGEAFAPAALKRTLNPNFKFFVLGVDIPGCRWYRYGKEFHFYERNARAWQ